MQLADGMMANMHKMQSAAVALTHAQGYAAPTGDCMTIQCFRIAIRRENNYDFHGTSRMSLLSHIRRACVKYAYLIYINCLDQHLDKRTKLRRTLQIGCKSLSSFLGMLLGCSCKPKAEYF
jgi:hypothetical protein